MDQDTIVASLKNDVSKLEKHINKLNTDLRVAYEEKRTVEMIHSMYKKETERDHATLKQAFIDLLDTLYQTKDANSPKKIQMVELFKYNQVNGYKVL